MFKFSLSVRAYHTGRKYGLPCFEKWAQYSDSELERICGNVGIMAIVSGRSMKTAIELLRASGMGAYAIFESLYFSSRWSDSVTLAQVKATCDHFDRTLHSSLD